MSNCVKHKFAIIIGERIWGKVQDAIPLWRCQKCGKIVKSM